MRRSLGLLLQGGFSFQGFTLDRQSIQINRQNHQKMLCLWKILLLNHRSHLKYQFARFRHLRKNLLVSSFRFFITLGLFKSFVNLLAARLRWPEYLDEADLLIAIHVKDLIRLQCLNGPF